MNIEITSPAAKQPVSLDEAKDFLRLVDSTDDSTVRRLIVAAAAQVEAVSGVHCISRTARIILHDFPRNGWVFPVSPVASISSIKYTDVDGNEQTVDSGEYLLEGSEYEPRLYLTEDGEWPSTIDQADAVRITAVTGYGDDADDVPPQIKQAILFLVSHWFENRTPVAIGTAASKIPDTVDYLIQSFKRFRG